MAPEEEERSLVLRAQGGERPAFDRLFVLHRPRIESLIRSRLRTGLRQEAEVEDVLQETLLRAFRSIRRFAWEGEGSFLRWLGSIAEHLIVDLARRAERGPRAPLDPDVAGSGVTQSKALRREERFDRLQEALRTLSPEHREVVQLARLERLPVKDIALRMNRSPDAVTHLLMRALRKLRETFGETDSFHLPDRVLKSGDSRDGA